MNLAVAQVMYQPETGEVFCAPMLFRNHMMHMKRLTIVQGLVTDRAEAPLLLGQLPLATGQARMGLCPSLSPIVLEGGVIGGRRGADKPMAFDLRPGEFP